MASVLPTMTTVAKVPTHVIVTQTAPTVILLQVEVVVVEVPLTVEVEVEAVTAVTVIGLVIITRIALTLRSKPGTFTVNVDGRTSLRKCHNHAVTTPSA
jgi:hypothetical protein